MTSHLCFLILPSLAVASQLGLENVFFSPEDQTVREGDGIYFQCVSGDSSPPATITWLKDGEPVERGKETQGEYGGGNQTKTSGTLRLLNVTLQDDGVYTCVTHNSLLNISKRSKPARLTVQGIPRKLQIFEGPDNLTVAIAAVVSMHCAVRGFPVPMVHWFKDGCLLTNCSASFSLRNNGQLLTFSNVTKDDEGWYHCEAFNHNDLVKSEPAFLLLAEMDWSFIQHPSDLTVMKGENVTFTCRPPLSRPAALVSWFKDNHPLTPADHVTLLHTGDLFFRSVQESDSGSYFCRASNLYLQRFLASRRATLTVQAPPSVRMWPQTLTVPVGARVLLECRVSGQPSPSISWLKRGHSKHTGGKISVGLRNASLYIDSARGYDEGVYVCVASNTLGQSRNSSVLRVAESPIIVTFSGHVSSRIGASVDLPCHAVGILPMNYTWSRGKAKARFPIGPPGDRFIGEDGTLHLSNVQQQDAGEYQCTAENRGGREQRQTILTLTAGVGPADGATQQSRLVLSADTSSSKDLQFFQPTDLLPEKQPKSTYPTFIEPNETTCFLPHCNTPANGARKSQSVSSETGDESVVTTRSLGQLLHSTQPQNSLTPLLATQLQPPMLPPPPYPSFKSIQSHIEVPPKDPPLLISESTTPKTSFVESAVTAPALTTSQRHSLRERKTSTAPFQQRLQDGLGDTRLTRSDSLGLNVPALPSAGGITEPEKLLPRLPSKHPPSQPPAFLNSDHASEAQTQSSKTSDNHSAAPSHLQVGLLFPQSLTKREYQQSASKSAHSRPSQAVGWKTQMPDLEQSSAQSYLAKFDLELSTVPHDWSSSDLPTRSPVDSAANQSRTEARPSPAAPAVAFTTTTRPQRSQLQPSTPWTAVESLPDRDSDLSTQQTSSLSIDTPGQNSDPSSKHPMIPDVRQTDTSSQSQLNINKQVNSVTMTKMGNGTRITEWLKKNTSQSPMTSNDPRATQSSPSWLPVLEKHDIPIVVGVGVSLAFIFITVSFYSVVQKNGPAPTSRAAQRSLGVPARHAERRAAGRTYENKAFEDDDCVAVVEQSPNTADTRARPPGPSLVTVHMEPALQELQQETLPASESHSVTVETYPEPILDTKIDNFLGEEEVQDQEEEKGCSLSQPSVQLQCSPSEWASTRADERSPCQDALPPPSPAASPSPCPSPPSTLQEGLRSSLTLRSAEASATPIHHSLSVSSGSAPLLLSHHVSLGLTTVAVDVHFHPAATVSTAAGTSTHINSVSQSTSWSAPLFTPPSVSSQDGHRQSK